MVMMVMGDEDVRQRPAFALQRLDDGGGFRRVDRRGGLGRGIVDQIAEIVAETGESTNFRGHDHSVGKAVSPPALFPRNMALTLIRPCHFPRASTKPVVLEWAP